MDVTGPDPLQAIRRRIDAIDEDIHRLLIDRSAVIDELIRVKGTSKPGAAFRPEREADMMRRMALRHRGNLPLLTVEHIWREIITTFTAMQAPFGVAVGPAVDPLLMRDLVRFYFGFTVPVSVSPTNESALADVAGQPNRLAVISADSSGPWWEPLLEPKGPKVFAKLPFIDTPERRAALPAYVVGPPLEGTGHFDVQLLAIPGTDEVDAQILTLGGRIVGRAGGKRLVEMPVAIRGKDVARACVIDSSAIGLCGGFAQPIRLLAPKGS